MAEFLRAVTRLAILVFILSSMAGAGLGLTLRQIITPLKRRRLVVLALVANFVISPLLAVGIARLMRLDESFAVGLLLLGLAPGAPFLPKVTEVVKGDLAFSVGLMVLLMTGSVPYLPLVLPLLAGGVQVDPWKIAQSLVPLMLGPLIAGLIVRARSEFLAARLRPWVSAVSSVSLLVVVVLIVALNLGSVGRLFGTGAVFAGLVFVVLSALTGWLLGGADNPTRKVLALGTGFRNIAAALVVAESFKDPRVAVMLIAVGLLGVFILLPIARRLGTDNGTKPNLTE